MNQVNKLQAQAVVPNQTVFKPSHPKISIINTATITVISSWKEIHKAHSHHPNTAASWIIKQTDIHLERLNILLIAQKLMQVTQQRIIPKSADLVHKVTKASNVGTPDILHVTARKRIIPRTEYTDPQNKIPRNSLILGTRETRDHQL